MRQDDAHVRIARDHTIEHHLHGSAGGVKRIVEHRSPRAQYGVDLRLGRMNEDYSFAAIQLGPHRLEGRIAEILAGAPYRAWPDHPALHPRGGQRLGIQKNPPSNVLPGSVWNKNTSKSSMA